ncbi:MAG TPA: class I SAM-dependent methyltransferase [Gemmatimonadales bacterium]|nr:class I SAM-dependent methyltransferase [Gemmatimonadales bacterium]
MSSCCASFFAANQRQFSDAVARRDLKRYRRQGPDQTTRLLRDAILGAGRGWTVLDVGAGIGALAFELLAAGAERVTAVEAAPAYVAAAREEAGRRNVADRLDLVNGDFVSVAGDVMPADVVTMDRVVCCYPAYQPLLEAALRRSRRLLAFSYPRDRWYVRAAVGMQNLSRALFRNPFRGFVHSARAMEALLEQHGFVRLRRHETLKWSADLYVRADAA